MLHKVVEGVLVETVGVVKVHMFQQPRLCDGIQVQGIISYGNSSSCSSSRVFLWYKNTYALYG